jgi:acyl carrier protein
MGTNGYDEQREITERLRSYIVENFLLLAGIDSFDDSDSFLERGIIDSTGVLELLEFVEGTFHIHVEDEEVIPDNLDSLNNLTSFIIRKAGNADRSTSCRTAVHHPKDEA